MNATTMTTSTLRTQRDALAAASDLYDRLYRDLRADTPEDRWGQMDAAYQTGAATLATLASTASDLPLSGDTRALLTGYLEGPAEDDLEGRSAWLTLLPELLVDVRRAQEAEHAALMQPVYGSRGLVWEDFGALFHGIREVEAVIAPLSWPKAFETKHIFVSTTHDWEFFAEQSARYVLDSWSMVIGAVKTAPSKSGEVEAKPAEEPKSMGTNSYALAA
jgi:hypothetical protein